MQKEKYKRSKNMERGASIARDERGEMSREARDT